MFGKNSLLVYNKLSKAELLVTSLYCKSNDQQDHSSQKSLNCVWLGSESWDGEKLHAAASGWSQSAGKVSVNNCKRASWRGRWQFLKSLYVVYYRLMMSSITPTDWCQDWGLGSLWGVIPEPAFVQLQNLELEKISMQQELGSLTEQVKVQATAAEDSLDKVGSSYGTLSDSSWLHLRKL